MKLSKTNILIFGLGKTGISCLKYLIKRKVNIFIYDDNKEIMKKYKKEKMTLFNEELIDCIEYVIISPGISKEHHLVKKLINKNIPIVSELEFSSCLLKASNVVAITGTNGKTTTTEMIAEILSTKSKTFKCGNIGIPIVDQVEKVTKNDFVVMEVSSFQLEDTLKFRPHVSVITNLAGDHLDRYDTIDSYWDAKKKIYQNQNFSDYVVVNENILTQINTKAQIFAFSTQKEVVGVFVRDDAIFFKKSSNDQPLKIIDVNEIQMEGKHNLENTLASICVAMIFDINLDDLKKTIKSFKTIEHRFEKIGSVNGIQFVNDSKATNIHSTLCAVSNLDVAIHLLLGGSDKGEDFENLFKNLPSNVKVYLFGSTVNKMVIACQSVGFTKFKICYNMKNALKTAYKNAKKHEMVLLSPACASFDAFKSYEERGKFFKEWVFELNEEG